MKIAFERLASIRPVHGYYRTACADFDFLPTHATRELMRSGRILARMQEGTLHLLFEAEALHVPLHGMSGATLVFGMVLGNPHFENFTAPVLGGARLTPRYSNRASATNFDPATGLEMAAALHVHTPALDTRPVTLTLKTEAGHVLDTRSLGSDEDSFSYDFRPLPAGCYTVSENYSGGASRERTLYVDSSLHGRIWGLIEIRIDAGFYLSAPTLEIPFQARADKLRYYVVASNYPQAEFDQLSVVDGDPALPNIVFDKILPPFSNAYIQDGLLRGNGDLIAVFESQAAVPRREGGYKKLRLNRSATTLIEHLPLPGPERASAELIVHLSKP